VAATVPAPAAPPAVAPLALARLSRIGFLTLPNYSAIALVNALEACRMANYVSLTEDYRWAVVTLDGAPVVASNGLSMSPTVRLADAGPLDLLFVCGGVSVRHGVDRKLSDALRRLARRGVALGGLCTGTFALAEAGLLDGYRAAIHWENLTAIREEFSSVAFTEELFVVDRERLTCTGGVAPLELMLTLIEARHGKPVAAKVSDQFMVERPRAGGDRQPLPLPSRIEHLHPALARAARMMDAAIERPLTVAEVAAGVGMSPRQLERLFRRHLGTSPAEFSLGRRLVHARELLRQTPMSVTDVGLACGFQTAAHFSTAYRRHFGRSPREERATP